MATFDDTAAMPTFADLLEQHVGADAAAAYRLGSTDYVLLAYEQNFAVLLCDDGGLPLPEGRGVWPRLWWKVRGFTAVTGVLPYSGRFSMGGVRWIELNWVSLPRLREVLVPGARVELDHDWLKKRWLIGVRDPDDWTGEVLWVSA